VLWPTGRIEKGSVLERFGVFVAIPITHRAPCPHMAAESSSLVKDLIAHLREAE
jgi:hypothetical protein